MLENKGPRGTSWSYDELLVALLFYSQLDRPEVVSDEQLAVLQDILPHRSKNSLFLRLMNFVARDPEMRLRGRKGMTGGGRHVDNLWSQVSDSEGRLIHRELVRKAIETGVICV